MKKKLTSENKRQIAVLNAGGIGINKLCNYFKAGTVTITRVIKENSENITQEEIDKVISEFLDDDDDTLLSEQERKSKEEQAIIDEGHTALLELLKNKKYSEARALEQTLSSVSKRIEERENELTKLQKLNDEELDRQLTKKLQELIAKRDRRGGKENEQQE